MDPDRRILYTIWHLRNTLRIQSSEERESVIRVFKVIEIYPVEPVDDERDDRS